MCNSGFESNHQGKYMRHGSQPEGPPAIPGKSILSPYFAAGFAFSTGQFVADVPYDPHLPMIFQGEEISMTVRGYTHGYDFYTPARSVCFHYYAIGENRAKRKKVKTFWEHSGDHAGSGKRSMNRLLGVIRMDPDLVEGVDYDGSGLDRYGLGSLREPEAFYEMFGIDVAGKRAAGGLCKFVASGNMQRRFGERLVKGDGGMDGPVDYDAIGKYRIPALEWD